MATVATTAIKGIRDVAYSFDWCQYPLDLRKYFILIMSRSQKPLYFTGFGMVRCTLQTYIKVMDIYCNFN